MVETLQTKPQTPPSAAGSRPLLSIVIPMLNEKDGLSHWFDRLAQVIQPVPAAKP